MNEQQEQQQQPGDATGTNRSIDQQQADAEAAKQQQAAANQGGAPAVDPNADPAKANQAKAGEHTGLLGRLGHAVEHDTGIEAWQRHEKRRQAFSVPNAAQVQAAVNDVNAFINAMHNCDADTPEEMLDDSDVQQAAKRAREGLKVFTGDTPVTFSKPTSDAHLNVGTGGAVTGNTLANKQRAAAIREQHGDPVAKADNQEGDEEDEDAVPAGVTKVPQPDAHVR